MAAMGGFVLVEGERDPDRAARVGGLVSRAAPAAEVRAVQTGSRVGSGRSAGTSSLAGPPWLQRMGDEDDMCCLAIVDPALPAPEQLAEIAGRSLELGWVATLVGRKLYAFPAGFGKERAATFVAEKVAKEAGAAPRRLAAGDTEHDRLMLADADLAWVPAGSDLAACADGEFTVTSQPGHAAAAQITQGWLDACAAR